MSLLPHPKTYICYQATGHVLMNGKLDIGPWSSAPWTDDFTDIEGDSKPTPRFKTRAKMLWDKDCLYIGAELHEPQIWATLHTHDSVIFHDNDFEVFCDPDNDGCFYSEMEMNALNTTWDLLLPRAYRGGGPAVDGFELHGMKTTVHIDGKLNDPSTQSKSWTVEIAIPWQAYKDICRSSLPPQDRDQWRINFSRVEWHVEVQDGRFVKVPNHPEDNWVWSPIGVVDMHRPEQWGILQFSTLHQGEVKADASPGFEQRRYLVSVWEAQQTYRRNHNRWAKTPEELEISKPGLKIYVGLDQFEMTFEGYRLDNTLRFSKL